MKPLLFFDVNQTDARYTLMENRANTIRARYGTGGGQYAVCSMADEKVTLTEKRFFKWYVDDISVSLRAKSGSYGGAARYSS